MKNWTREHGHFSSLPYSSWTCIQYGYAVDTSGHVPDTSWKCLIFFKKNYRYVWTHGGQMVNTVRKVIVFEENGCSGKKILVLNKLGFGKRHCFLIAQHTKSGERRKHALSHQTEEEEEDWTTPSSRTQFDQSFLLLDFDSALQQNNGFDDRPISHRYPDILCSSFRPLSSRQVLSLSFSGNKSLLCVNSKLTCST